MLAGPFRSSQGRRPALRRQISLEALCRFSRAALRSRALRRVALSNRRSLRLAGKPIPEPPRGAEMPHCWLAPFGAAAPVVDRFRHQFRPFGGGFDFERSAAWASMAGVAAALLGGLVERFRDQFRPFAALNDGQRHRLAGWTLLEPPRLPSSASEITGIGRSFGDTNVSP